MRSAGQGSAGYGTDKSVPYGGAGYGTDESVPYGGAGYGTDESVPYGDLVIPSEAEGSSQDDGAKILRLRASRSAQDDKVVESWGRGERKVREFFDVAGEIVGEMGGNGG